MEHTATSLHNEIQSRHRALAAIAAFLMSVAILVSTAAPALAVCSGNVGFTTSSYKYWAGSPSYYASWSGQTHTAGAPCVDVNVKNTGWDEQAFVGRYYSGGWKSGAVGWVDIEEGYLGVVISNLTATGVAVRVGAAENSWSVRILT